MRCFAPSYTGAQHGLRSGSGGLPLAEGGRGEAEDVRRVDCDRQPTTRWLYTWALHPRRSSPVQCRMSQLSPDLERGSARSDISARQPRAHLNQRAVIAGLLFIAIIGLAIWYLARPEPLLAQGERERTRIDIAARVSGRLAKIAVARGRRRTTCYCLTSGPPTSSRQCKLTGRS